MRLGPNIHLTYCSNIHPGESWKEVHQNLATYLPEVRRQLHHDGSFGIGLRLSAQAAETLETPETLAAFRGFLEEHNGYVFTINGFPYGVFHGTRVKEEVYLPDWRDEARLVYTCRLARILAALLPDEPGLEGSISTLPGAFKGEIRSEDDASQMARLMLKQVEDLHELREKTGRTITLALEPEPCCYPETVNESVEFFERFLRHPSLVRELADATALSLAEAELAVRRHIGLSYDACHMAVEFEELKRAFSLLKGADIKICKFQISSALKLRFISGDGRAAEILSPFDEGTYLHQVVERSSDGLRRYVDLPQALAEEERIRGEGTGGTPKEWRVHFHVPVFLGEMSGFATTQDYLVELMNCIKSDPVCPYLEVETYTWDVLPSEYKTTDMASAIARELAWVRDQLAA